MKNQAVPRTRTVGQWMASSHLGSDVPPRSGRLSKFASFAGLPKRAAFYWHHLLRVRATPHEIALGCAVGVFAACTPFLGLQMLLAGLLAFLLRVSIPAAVLGTFIGNPLSWPAIWSASYLAGAWIMGVDPAYAADRFSESANVLSATLMKPSPATLNMAVESFSPIVAPMLVGGATIGLILGLFSYYPMRRAVRIFQKGHDTH